MGAPLFTAKTFIVPGSDKIACLVTGYRGKISSYKKVIALLNQRGYTVVAYEHSATVLTKGDPSLLPLLVRQLCDDFAKRAVGSKTVICTGASIGAGLCFALQRHIPNVQFGIYAGAGVSPPETVHEASLFYFVRHTFARRGYTKADLQAAWAEVDILPGKNFSQTPFVIALGKKDRIVNYEKAISTLMAWQRKGQSIRIITNDRLGHRGIIGWYKKHFPELLDEAEKHLPN